MRFPEEEKRSKGLLEPLGHPSPRDKAASSQAPVSHPQWPGTCLAWSASPNIPALETSPLFLLEGSFLSHLSYFQQLVIFKEQRSLFISHWLVHDGGRKGLDPDSLA